jgi:hypothetical protein
MSIKLFYLGFDLVWPDFKKDNLFFKLLKPEDRVVSKLEDSNVVIIGCSLTFNEFNNLLVYKGIRILYISEPLYNIEFCLFSRLAHQCMLYDYIFGCINNDISNNKFKYPLYMASFENMENMELTKAKPKLNFINDKKYCCLISRHDGGNTRTSLYHIMNKFGHIECPSILFNNCPNKYLNEVGIVKYTSDFVFNLCCENSYYNHRGYVTEKLMNCCLAGAIPVYIGHLDEIDKKIFNLDRIIIPNLKNTLEFIRQINTLVSDINELKKFYNQNVFMDTAVDTLKDLQENPKRLITEIRTQLKEL